MGKFFLIFTQLFLIILSSTTYAEDYCEDFFDQISKFDTKYEIESNSINQFFSPSGITLGLVYNSKDSWKHLTIDGYPIIKSLLPSLKIRKSIRKTIMYFGTSKTPELSNEMKLMLLDYYSENIESLSSLLGKNLNYWWK